MNRGGHGISGSAIIQSRVQWFRILVVRTHLKHPIVKRPERGVAESRSLIVNGRDLRYELLYPIQQGQKRSDSLG